MTLHPELINRRRIIISDLLFLSIVSHTHANVILASIAPDIVWHLEPDREDPFSFPLFSSFTKRMMTMICVETFRHDFGIVEEVRRIVVILSFAFTHLRWFCVSCNLFKLLNIFRIDLFTFFTVFWLTENVQNVVNVLVFELHRNVKFMLDFIHRYAAMTTARYRKISSRTHANQNTQTPNFIFN